ncbi:hypothetical protein [Mycolicibacterium wolinskyi]|uniref:hypothetical protein n=1 Tax=Mycolicibacterium wolinskyi TaxID=59750 RepID=UPI003917A809
MTNALGDNLGWNLLAPFVYTIAMMHGGMFCVSKVVQTSRFERIARWGKRLEIVAYLTTALMSFTLLKTWPEFADTIRFVEGRMDAAGLPADAIAQITPGAMVHAALSWAELYLLAVTVISVCYGLAVVGRRHVRRTVSSEFESWTRQLKREIREAEEFGRIRYRRLAAGAPTWLTRHRRWLHDNPPEPLVPARPRWEFRWVHERHPSMPGNGPRQDRYRLTNRTGLTAFNVTTEPVNLDIDGTRSKLLVAARSEDGDNVFMHVDTVIGFTGQMTVHWHGPDHHEHAETIHLQYTPVSQHNRYYWLRKWRRRKNRMRAGEPQPESLVGAGVHDG